jgi:hypothetical protein
MCGYADVKILRRRFRMHCQLLLPLKTANCKRFQNASETLSNAFKTLTKRVQTASKKNSRWRKTFIFERRVNAISSQFYSSFPVAALVWCFYRQTAMPA